MNKLGKVYLVGAGCGDYDLITLRGMNLLKTCDTVVYDSLIDSRLLDFTADTTEKICVGKRAGHHSEKQERINEILVENALNGKTVVRLKGGDPFVFGRGGEEILALKKHNISYSIVPGISSTIAVPELAGIPVTHRKTSRSFHVITGHTAEDLIPENIKKYASTDETLVILMGLNNLSKIAETLILNGKDKNTPAAVISHGASAKQKTIRSDLKNIADEVKKHKIKTPAVIIIGETAAFDFSTNINRPLTGVSVSVTGTEKLVDKLSEQLYALGADINKLDYLQICEYGNNKIFYDYLLNIQKYSMIVLTSMNGAEIFLKHLKKLKIDIRKLGNVKFAVIGNGTGEILEKAGIYPDIIPEIYTAKELGKRIAETVSETDKLLILRAEKGSSDLTDVLDKSGIIYDDIKIYDVKMNNKKEYDEKINSNFITFASSSGVNAFFENGFSLSDSTEIICIGEVTSQALIKKGIDKFYISDIQNVQGIIDTILREVKNEQIQTYESE